MLLFAEPHGSLIPPNDQKSSNSKLPGYRRKYHRRCRINTTWESDGSIEPTSVNWPYTWRDKGCWVLFKNTTLIGYGMSGQNKSSLIFSTSRGGKGAVFKNLWTQKKQSKGWTTNPYNTSLYVTPFIAELMILLIDGMLHRAPYHFIFWRLTTIPCLTAGVILWYYVIFSHTLQKTYMSPKKNRTGDTLPETNSKSPRKSWGDLLSVLEW